MTIINVVVGLFVLILTNVALYKLFNNDINFASKITEIFPEKISAFLLKDSTQKLGKLSIGALLENHYPIFLIGKTAKGLVELIEYGFLGVAICFLFDVSVFIGFKYFLQKKAKNEIEKFNASVFMQKPIIKKIFKNLHWSIIFYRFIPMIRIPILAANSLYTSTHSFMIYNFIGAVLWVGVFIAAGVFKRGS